MATSWLLRPMRVCCALGFLIFLTAEVAAAQTCPINVTPAQDHSDPGKSVVYATTWEDCSSFSTQTEVWIGYETSIYCFGLSKSGHVCFHFSPSHAWARGSILAYGFWTGYSNTPILIPLSQGRAMKLTSIDQGVLFDMNADGLLDWTGWTDWNSKLAFLAIDRNGNGVVDDGSELFGDYTIPGARNGFIALQEMNMALNGGVPRASINADEPLFERLLLWEDENHNGISEPHEIQPAAPLLSDIGLGYMEHKRRDRHGNLLKWKGWASLRTGPGRNEAVEPSHQQARRLDIFDVYFVTKR